MKRSILFGVALSLFAGCSGDDEPGPGAAGSTSLKTTVAFCNAWAKAACNEEVVSACDAESAEACIESQEASCRDLIPFGYDPTNAKACLDAVEEAYTDADLSSEELGLVLQLTAPCDELIKGTALEGESCAASTDCNTLDGLRCIVKTGETRGECHEPKEVGGGESCEGADEVCGADFYCDGENCLKRKALDDECSYDNECEATARCDATTNADGVPEGTCIARKETGETCASDAECQSHLCATPRGASSGVCVSRVRLSAESAFCEDLR